MSRFSHVAKLKIDPAMTSPYTIEEIVGRPVLHLLHAGRSNHGYFNARLRSAKAAAKKTKGKGRAAIEAAAEEEAYGLERDREMFPKYVVTGWERVVDDDGADVPFSVESCAEFIEALPDDIFEGARLHAMATSNYRETSDGDDDELEKNS